MDVVQKTPNFEFILSPKNKAERTVLIEQDWNKGANSFCVFVSGDQKIDPPGKQQIYLPLFATLILCSENHSYAALIKSLF